MFKSLLQCFGYFFFFSNASAASRASFKEAVDHYLATCAKLGDEPNKPYSGKLTLRIPPNVHAAIATAAEINGKSLNKWAADVLDQAADAQ